MLLKYDIQVTGKGVLHKQAANRIKRTRRVKRGSRKQHNGHNEGAIQPSTQQEGEACHTMTV